MTAQLIHVFKVYQHVEFIDYTHDTIAISVIDNVHSWREAYDESIQWEHMKRVERMEEQDRSEWLRSKEYGIDITRERKYLKEWMDCKIKTWNQK